MDGKWEPTWKYSRRVCKANAQQSSHKVSFDLKSTCNNFFHNFRSTRINTLYARIGPSACNRVFPHVAVAAMQLHALIANTTLCFGFPQFYRSPCIDTKLFLDKQLSATDTRALLQFQLVSKL